LTPENRKHNISLEVTEAEERLKMAEIGLPHGLYKSVAASAYYGAFHYARALLLMEGLEPKTHGGLVHLLNLHFIRAQRLSPEMGKLLNDLQSSREQAEYDSASVFTEDMAREVLRQARVFAEAAARLLRDGGWV